MTLSIGFGLFAVFVVVLELATGCAVVGWTGDNMVVVREESPGPYWFTVILHSLAALGIPALAMIAGM